MMNYNQFSVFATDCAGGCNSGSMQNESIDPICINKLN